MANKRDTQQQQQQQQSQSQKKPSTADSKKTNEPEDATGAGPSSTAPSDVYEFVSTPKHSSCSSGSGDEHPSKNSDKSSDDKSGTDSDTAPNQQQKRPSEQQVPTDESSSTADDDAKRKKRKDSELKEGNKPTVGTNRVTSRVGQKPPGPASKTMGLVNKGTASNSNDRKSPSEMSAKSPESDTENDDGKEGPKVPPLKIVIPQQAPGGTEVQETQNIS